MTLNPWKMKATCSSEMSDTSASPHHTRPESSITPLWNAQSLQTTNLPYLPHLILSTCARSWKALGSIPDGVTGFFIDLIRLAALWPGGQPNL